MALASKKTIRISITLLEEQYTEILHIAEANRISAAEVIRQAVGNLLNDSVRRSESGGDIATGSKKARRAGTQ